MYKTCIILCATALTLSLHPSLSYSAVPEDTLPNAPAGHLQPHYKVTDLGDLGGKISIALSINDKGQIVGGSRSASGRSHGFLWETGKMTDLGVLPKTVVSMARSINNKGQIAGESSDLHGNMFGVLWETGKMTSLGPLGGEYGTVAMINDHGVIVGQRHKSKTERCGFVWSKGLIADSDTLSGDCLNAKAINDAGLVLGEAPAGPGDNQDRKSFLWDHGKVIDLAAFQALCLNNKGQIAGQMTDTKAGSTPAVWEAGKVRPLPSLKTIRSAVSGINDRGDIVGWADLPSGADGKDIVTHALLWQGDQCIDLNERVDSTEGWTIETAEDINSAGQIVGMGLHAGQEHAYLLTPIAP